MQLPPKLDLRSTFDRLRGQLPTAPSTTELRKSVADGAQSGVQRAQQALNGNVEALRKRAGAVIGGDVGRAGTINGGNRTLHRLQGDLNKSAIDDSPLVVTNAEVRSAHQALLAAGKGELNDTLRSLPDELLNRYLSGVAAAQPFSLEERGASPLQEFALRLARDVEPAVGAGLVARLDDMGKRKLLEGVLQLDGADVAKLRAVLGDDGFRSLARGGKDGSLIGGALGAGRVWKQNVTDDFKGNYRQALDGTLPLPPQAKETVFLTGPGLFGDQLPGYLEPNRKALEEWGVPAENVAKLKYNTADDPAANADKIFQQIKAQHDAGKRVVVMGHSKFGRDMLEAFRRHPELKQMVAGAIMMQPAISAPIAQDLGKPGFQKLLDPVLQLVGGNRGAFNGLSEQAAELPPWPSDVPTMVYASSTESPHALLHASTDPYYEHVYNAASDGAVAFQDQAALDGSYLVTLPGLADHAQPGLTFKDGLEHFAAMLDKGAPDDVVKGMLERFRAMSPFPGAFDAIVKLYKGAHSSPAVRAQCAQMMRELGPMLDDVARRQNARAGYPMVDNHAMTKALVAQLFDKMA